MSIQRRYVNLTDWHESPYSTMTFTLVGAGLVSELRDDCEMSCEPLTQRQAFQQRTPCDHEQPTSAYTYMYFLKNSRSSLLLVLL